MASEELIKEFNYSNNLTYIINRIGVISGPWQFGKLIKVSLAIGAGLINEKKLKYIGFNGSGMQVRDILHIDDLCELIFTNNQNKKINNLTLSFGGGLNNSISLKQLTKKLEKYQKIF